MKKEPTSITFEIEPGLKEKYIQPIFAPEAFESLIQSKMLTDVGDIDGEPYYNTTLHFEFVMRLLDYCQTEVRRSRKAVKRKRR